MLKRVAMLTAVFLLLMVTMGSVVLAAPWAQEEAGEATPTVEPAEPPAPPVEESAPAQEQPAGEAGAAWKSQVTRPGVYIFYDYRNYNPADFPGAFVGGHMSFEWRQIEPSKNSFNWAPVDEWIAEQAALGKPVGLEIIAFIGASSYSPSVKGNVAPGYLPKITCQDVDGRYFDVPAYHYSTFMSEYQRVVNAFGARYNNDSRVEWIEIATGVDGENQPVQPNSGNNLENCLITAGLSQYQWEEYMKRVVDYYLAAFPNKPLMVQHYPTHINDSERRTISQYAAPLGVGFKGNGLIPDRDKATRRNDPAHNHYLAYLDDPTIGYSTTVPIGFETYGFYLTDPIYQYWAVLNGLDKHADYFAMGSDTFTDGNAIRLESLRFANRYLGKSASNTPEIWVALRESGYTFYPQYGNYSFYLKQDDSVPGGTTRAVTYRAAGTGAYQIQNTAMVDAWVDFLSGTKEGWITRRTNQSTGNPYMWFKADDSFINGGTNAISITVTYFDRGTDTWALDYDGPSGAYTSAGTVTKGNTNTWKKHTFYIDNARMANGLLGLSDFRLDCKNDGDEYIHMVMLAKRSGQPTQEIALRNGANLVSVPLTTASTAIADVLTSVSGKYTKVFAFDGETKNWKSFDVGVPNWANTLQNIDRTMGFWVYMNSDGTLSVTGSQPASTTIALKNGANLIGFPRSNAQAVADALASISGKYTKVFEYDASSTSWKSYDASLPGWANTLQQMRPGYGYWVYVNQDCTLTITN